MLPNKYLIPLVVCSALALAIVFYSRMATHQNDVSLLSHRQTLLSITSHPVILVPGIYSSKLVAIFHDTDTPEYKCFNKREVTLWMNTTLLSTPSDETFDCFVNMLKVNNLVNSTKGKTKMDADMDTDVKLEHHTERVTFATPGFGQTDTVKWLGDPNEQGTDYMHKFITMLESLGFSSLHAAVFDFRYSPDYLDSQSNLYEKLTYLIMDKYEESGRKKVIITCHSMGCLLSLVYLQSLSQTFKDKYIERLVALAGAFGGSTNSLYGLTYGYDFHLGLPGNRVRAFRDTFRTQPASYFMLPNPSVFPTDQPIAKYGEGKDEITFTPSQMEQLFITLNLTKELALYREFKNVHDVTIGPGVDVHCMYGVKVPTINMVMVPSLDALQQDAQFNIHFTIGDGDGVVDEASLATCKLWAPSDQLVLLGEVLQDGEEVVMKEQEDKEVLLSQSNEATITTTEATDTTIATDAAASATDAATTRSSSTTPVVPPSSVDRNAGHKVVVQTFPGVNHMGIITQDHVLKVITDMMKPKKNRWLPFG